jgi:Fe-coproporphyrin III synthase
MYFFKRYLFTRALIIFIFIGSDSTDPIVLRKSMTRLEEKVRIPKTKQNILDYTAGSNRNWKPAWKDIWITMTINSSNHSGIVDLIQEWKELVSKIGFQFHIPFAKGDPLWLPFGQGRNKAVDKLIALRKKYPNFIIDNKKTVVAYEKVIGEVLVLHQYNVLHGQSSLRSYGKREEACCMGSADSKSLKPICADCGLGCYSVLVTNGFTG